MGLEKSCVQVWAQMPAMPDRVITFAFIVNGLNLEVAVSSSSFSVIVRVRVVLKRVTSYELTAQDSLSQGREILASWAFHGRSPVKSIRVYQFK